MALSHRFFTPIKSSPFSSSSSRLQLVSNVSYSFSNSAHLWKSRNPSLSSFRVLNSIGLHQILSEESAISAGFLETIEELSRNARDPGEILADRDRLSPREIQLVLVYFSQEGRDSWCALEVFDWLRRGDRVDDETMELMVSIMCGWMEKLISGDHGVEDVVDLMKDMDCVGLKPRFSMIEKVISLYWELGKKEEAIMFVKDVLQKGVEYVDDGGGGSKGGPTGYLAWKMMADGDYMGAVKLVIGFKESMLEPEVYSYLIAMTALIKEQNEFSKVLRKLKGLTKTGLLTQLDITNVDLIEKYQLDLLKDGVRLSDWALQEGGSSILGLVRERLLAMYTCAGQGLAAEQQLWKMKLAGKEPDRGLYDIVLAICASQKETGAVRRLLAGLDAPNMAPRKKTLSWLLRGYIKGGHFEEASETLIKMLDLGFHPDYMDRVAVLQGLRRNIQQLGTVEIYLNLCKRLSDADLIGPCLLYLHISGYKLWIIRMI